MGITGKLSAQVEVKEIGARLAPSSAGLTPSVNGEQQVAKEIIEAIDEHEEKKSITFNVIEGDLLEFYKTLKVILEVETRGNDDLVTWTLEYEKMKEDIEEPFIPLQLLIKTAKDIDTHHCGLK
ncbi:kirola-like [Henckelia pumila]|uniref:kirola-like n=1 Tax=Henckelia pumila TaxID=405737 RepID=UPI003C6E42A7